MTLFSGLSPVAQYTAQDVSCFSVESLMELFEFAAQDRGRFSGEKYWDADLNPGPNDSSFTPEYGAVLDRYSAARNLLSKKLKALGIPVGAHTTFQKYTIMARARFEPYYESAAATGSWASHRATILKRAAKAQEK